MVYLHKAYLNTTAKVDVLNVTHDVKRALRESQILNGLLTVYVPGSAASVVILENDPSLREELKTLIDTLVPDEKAGSPRPSRRSGSGRSEAHLRGALFPTSVAIPIKDGRLLLGPWQEVLAFDFDDKPTRREIFVHVMGEGEEKGRGGPPGPPR